MSCSGGLNGRTVSLHGPDPPCISDRRSSEERTIFCPFFCFHFYLVGKWIYKSTVLDGIRETIFETKETSPKTRLFISGSRTIPGQTLCPFGPSGNRTGNPPLHKIKEVAGSSPRRTHCEVWSASLDGS